MRYYGEDFWRTIEYRRWYIVVGHGSPNHPDVRLERLNTIKRLFLSVEVVGYVGTTIRGYVHLSDIASAMYGISMNYL